MAEKNPNSDPPMGKPKEKKPKRPKERWLLSRKTWRYMADAGRKLIPDGAQNRPEDIPKIEEFFQEVCKREKSFLLWRKNSYPGALGFRSKKRKDWRKSGGSCRKASSADSIEGFRAERPSVLDLGVRHRYDVRRMKEEFMNRPYSPQEATPEEEEEKQFLNMLENFLKITDEKESVSDSFKGFDYEDLVNRLQKHLSLISRNVPVRRYESVPFYGDHLERSVYDTLSRYFSGYPNRDKVISDLLTNRRALEKLYFDLRKAKGFKSRIKGIGTNYGNSGGNTSSGLGSENSSASSKFYSKMSALPEIAIVEVTRSFATQTLPIPSEDLQKIEEDYKKALREKEEEEREFRPHSRRKSSVDHDDVSQSVSDTIKRYLRMARKKSVDTDKADRFKRVNYDRNLRNIKAKGEITKPGDDDGLNKGCQTNDDWILTYRDLKFDDYFEESSNVSSGRGSLDASADGFRSCPNSPPGILSSGQSFLSHLIHGGGKHGHDKNEKVSTGGTAMQKSKSSSSVMHHGGRLMAKKIFRSRSKSQVRAATPSSWTPLGGCVWTNVNGRQVVLEDTSLLHLSEIERQVIQKVALAKLQSLNLGVTVKIPSDSVSSTNSKPKRKPYLLKRKALTTSIFDTSRKDTDKDKDGAASLVFGIPLTQCVENDRVSRVSSGGSSFRSRRLPSAGDETGNIKRHGSRASFSSLSEPQREDESDSCESTASQKRITGSVPGLLDSISCGSTADIVLDQEEETAVPNIISECIRHLEANGLHTLGIFRVSTSKKRIRQLREDFDCGKETTLDSEQCPHDVATLLKEYLRDLPDPLLCRDLYHAFVQSQKVRNRRLQFEALQHLIQLLPPANRDTLWSLLNFLSLVAKNSADTQDSSGECLSGNKMDSNNLATVFAPNILHCIKPNSSRDTSGDRPEDRLDVINVVRTLIDHHQQLFNVPAELLDEVYVHLMDSHPEVLDKLLNKKDALGTAADESVDEIDSESNSSPYTTTLTSQETPIDNIFHNLSTEGNQERRKTYSREEFLHETAATGGPNVAMRIRYKDRIRERGSKKKRDDSTTRRNSKTIVTTTTTTKCRSSSLESTDDQNFRLNDRKPYILDDSGVITASLTIPVQTYNLDDDIPYIEQEVKAPRRRYRSTSGSDSSGVAHPEVFSNHHSSSVPESSSPSWASSPPTSPDSSHTTANYIPEKKQPSPSLQKVSFVSAPEVQQIRHVKREEPKTSSLQRTPSFYDNVQEPRERNFTPSISNIGNAVLRSRTADFERIAKADKTKQKTTASTSSEKKKYTKRRYTDSRHQTRHIPDSEALEAASVGQQKKEAVGGGQAGPVYKRRELISSEAPK